MEPNENPRANISFMKKLILVILCVASPAFADCVTDLVNLKGKEWRDARSRPLVQRLKKQTRPVPARITVHYTGAKKNPRHTLAKKLKGVFNFSVNETTKFKKELWGDIPYHFYVDMNGELAEGRDPIYQADTNTNYLPDGHVTAHKGFRPGKCGT